MSEENPVKHGISPPIAKELSVLFSGLANNSSTVVLLSMVLKYADHFVSKADEEPSPSLTPRRGVRGSGKFPCLTKLLLTGFCMVKVNATARHIRSLQHCKGQEIQLWLSALLCTDSHRAKIMTGT